MADLFVGRKIACLRRKLHISQENLAEKAKISVTTVSRIENDKEVMRVDIMLGLCNVFNITPNELFGYESQEQDKIMLLKNGLADLMTLAETLDFGE